MLLLNAIRTPHLAGRPPSEDDAGVYAAVYGGAGPRELQRNLQDYARYTVSPWTLQLCDRTVGVGGFRIGLGTDYGIELTLALVPNATPVGLAGDFLRDSIRFAIGMLRADRVFSYADADTTLSVRMLTMAGFDVAGPAPIPGRPDRRIMRWTAANRQRA